ncbi:MAG TPA: response regulator [Bryobacteraceae bacterium]|nr:response regulator [Bryobacteraceae bacterium]
MPRILVADDDPTQLELRAKLLETGGHQVSVACCPSETLRLLPSADLVVMDLRFRNQKGDSDANEGISLIRRIRESGCRAPVIVISGWPQDLEGRPEERMVSRIIAKPVGLAALLTAIAEVLI